MDGEEVIALIGLIGIAALILFFIIKDCIFNRNKKRIVIEAMYPLESRLEFTTIDHGDKKRITAVKEKITSFHGLRDIKKDSLAVHQLSMGKIDNMTVNVIYASYKRKIERANYPMEHTLIMLSSKKFQLPELSLRLIPYWGLYNLLNIDLEETRYFKSYKPIVPNDMVEQAMEMNEDEATDRLSPPAVLLSAAYVLDATEAQLENLKTILTTDIVEALITDPFMMVETRKNHLLLMKGTGYEVRLQNALKPSPLLAVTQSSRDIASIEANGYLTCENVVDTVKEAIRLGQLFRQAQPHSSTGQTR